jgi:hypothetical protein
MSANADFINGPKSQLRCFPFFFGSYAGTTHRKSYHFLSPRLARSFTLCLLQQGTQRLDGNSERSSRESVHVREINADHFASGIEHRTATATGVVVRGYSALYRQDSLRMGR